MTDSENLTFLMITGGVLPNAIEDAKLTEEQLQRLRNRGDEMRIVFKELFQHLGEGSAEELARAEQAGMAIVPRDIDGKDVPLITVAPEPGKGDDALPFQPGVGFDRRSKN